GDDHAVGVDDEAGAAGPTWLLALLRLLAGGPAHAHVHEPGLELLGEVGKQLVEAREFRRGSRLLERDRRRPRGLLLRVTPGVMLRFTPGRRAGTPHEQRGEGQDDDQHAGLLHFTIGSPRGRGAATRARGAS